MSLALRGIVELLLRSHWALTTVVTTIIIIVISVLLAATVSYFAINVTGTRMQEESILLARQHVWFNSLDGQSQAAILIVNTGGRDISVQKVTVRGQTVNWSETFYYKGRFTLTTDITYIKNISEDSLTPISDGVSSFEEVIAVHGDLPLCMGESMLVYVKNPDSITVNDIGQTVAIDVYTSQAIYYKEANVETPVLSGHK
jgi:FlaG/FlaF family flagellin (archaellin)